MSRASPRVAEQRQSLSVEASLRLEWDAILKRPIQNFDLRQWALGIRISEYPFYFIMFLINQSAFEFLGWEALWALQEYAVLLWFWWVECNQLLQSLRKGNPCSKLVTDSFKRLVWAQLFTLLPVSHVPTALFSALHVIPEKIEAFLCAGDGAGLGSGGANPPHGCGAGPQDRSCQGVFSAFAEIKELMEGDYSSFMGCSSGTMHLCGKGLLSQLQKHQDLLIGKSKLCTQWPHHWRGA